MRACLCISEEKKRSKKNLGSREKLRESVDRLNNSQVARGSLHIFSPAKKRREGSLFVRATETEERQEENEERDFRVAWKGRKQRTLPTVKRKELTKVRIWEANPARWNKYTEIAILHAIQVWRVEKVAEKVEGLEERAGWDRT